MEQYKRAQVIMLPTENNTGVIVRWNNELSLNTKKQDSRILTQHLYIISDDEIKKGDWCIDLKDNFILQMKVIPLFLEESKIKKIIATTDRSLKINTKWKVSGVFDDGLPQPSQQFIEKYIESYNKGEVITDVLVEYEDVFTQNNEVYIHSSGARGNYSTHESKLKVSLKDNTITIKKLKDSWNREEMIKLLNKLNNTLNIGSDLTLEQWIEENL